MTEALDGPDGSLDLSLEYASRLCPGSGWLMRSNPATDSAQMMLDQAYDAALASGKYTGVDAFIGGTGSGKSVTSEATPLSSERRAGRIILESHAENAESLGVKIEKALEQGLPVDMHIVIRDPEDSYESVVGRYNRAESKQAGSGKAVPVNYGAAAHEAVIQNVPMLMELYGDEPLVTWHFIDNRGPAEEAREVSTEEGLGLLASIDTAELRDRFNEVLDNTKLTRRDRERFTDESLPAELATGQDAALGKPPEEVNKALKYLRWK